MDEIRIGLDFGTHQTKICIQRTPDEGHGVPEYEFFKFHDLNGNEQYFLPSVVQIDKDDTLSYGYVDPEYLKDSSSKSYQPVSLTIDEETEMLYKKYSDEKSNGVESKAALIAMLNKKREIDDKLYQERLNDDHISICNHEENLFRYFKQASLAEYPWEGKYNPNLLCIWYLAYVIFLLEDRYPDGFGINMGVPTDDKTFNQKRELGTQLLISAFHLVEDEYNKDFRKFLKAKVSDLLKKTVIPEFSEDDKDLYRINIFPEAYASLNGLTSRGKLTEGMSVNADIGGGTTDISFFIVKDRIPKIYKYWSLPRGLNYIAEMSGFDYYDKDFIKNARQEVIDKFNSKKDEVVYNLIQKLIELVRAHGLFKSNLINALRNRILVYNGGGSTYSEITKSVYSFTDVRVADSELWAEEIVKEKNKVSKLFNLLTTAYGLSVSENDSDVVLCDLDTIFASYNNTVYDKQEIDKDVC